MLSNNTLTERWPAYDVDFLGIGHDTFVVRRSNPVRLAFLVVKSFDCSMWSVDHPVLLSLRLQSIHLQLLVLIQFDLCFDGVWLCYVVTANLIFDLIARHSYCRRYNPHNTKYIQKFCIFISLFQQILMLVDNKTNGYQR